MSIFEKLFPSLEGNLPFHLPTLNWEVNGSIGEASEIAQYVVIEDNVQIGKNCLIRSHVLLRSGTVIGDNCVIGHGTEIKNMAFFIFH